MTEDGVRNKAGGVQGPVVQAGSISGGVHIEVGAASLVPAGEQWLPAGRPVAECTARDLGVYEAVVVNAEECGDPLVT